MRTSNREISLKIHAKATYKVICVVVATTGAESIPHTHIVEIGVADDVNPPPRLSAVEVGTMIDAGYLFYTQSPSSGRTALIEPYTCHCGELSLRSNADAESEHNLDNLAVCR